MKLSFDSAIGHYEFHEFKTSLEDSEREECDSVIEGEREGATI